MARDDCNHIKCCVCGEIFRCIKHTHLRKHDMKFSDYKIRFPMSETMCECMKEELHTPTKKNDYPIECEICGCKLIRVTTAHLRKHGISYRDYVGLYPDALTYIKKERLSGIPGVDYVNCMVCGERQRSITYRHLKIHGLSVEEYKFKFVGEEMMCEDSRKIHSQSVSRSMKGKIPSDACRMALKKANVKRFSTLESRILVSEKTKEAYRRDPTIKERIGQGLKKFYVENPEVRKEIGRRNIAHIREHPERHPNVVMANQQKFGRGYVSKPQMKLYELMCVAFEGVKLNYPIRTRESVRFADVALIDFKIDVEYDCEYWHDVEKDRKRDRDLLEVGWRTVRVSEESEFEKVLANLKCKVGRCEI